VIFRDGFALGLKVRNAQSFLEAFGRAHEGRPECCSPVSRYHPESDDLGADEAALSPTGKTRVAVEVEDEAPKVCGQSVVKHFVRPLQNSPRIGPPP